MSLETIVRKVGLLTQKVVGYALPFLDPYDYKGEANEILKDDEIRRQGLSKREIADYLNQSVESNKWIYRFAKFADSADRVTSAFGVPIEAAGVAAGMAPGWFASFGEEAIEMGFKLPFLIKLYLNPDERHRLKGILLREAATVIPVAGDVYDIASNLYIRNAKETLREDAKRRILGDRRDRTIPGQYRVLEDRMGRR